MTLKVLKWLLLLKSWKGVNGLVMLERLRQILSPRLYLRHHDCQNDVMDGTPGELLLGITYSLRLGRFSSGILTVLNPDLS